MCGLTGFWGPAREPEAALHARALRMADTLAHRGPDDSGIWTDAEAGVALAFRRLAIVDLSPTGHQPMVSADGRFVITFNGEIYNYRELRAELVSQGVTFRGTSDTEVILALCMRDGPREMLAQVWGMFAMVIWDRQERRLMLARDRLGKKPLYYGLQDGVLLYGSELKALRAHSAFRAAVDRDALTSYARFGYVPAPRSIYAGIHKLMPGSAVIFSAPHHDAVPFAYWSVEDAARRGQAERLESLTDAEAVDQLDALLRDAVARRMIADVPLGAFLSGGIDSSAVVALMQAQNSRPVRTFTIGFDITGYDEAQAARAVAEHLHTDHTELYVTPQQTLDVVPRLPQLYDEPFADSSQIPTFLVSQLARQHVTVALSGDGGDETFGGYTRYRWADSIWRSLRRVPRPVRALAAAGVGKVSPQRWNQIYDNVEWAIPGRARQSHPADKLYKLAALADGESADDIYLRLVSTWRQPTTVVLGGHEAADPLGIASAHDVAPNLVERMMLLDFQTYLPDDILVKVDRATMATSLEGRAPLLDHRVVEWAWRLPLRFKVRQGQGKWILRQVLERYVPRTLFDRPKMGFGVPIGPWLRTDLRDWAESLLAPDRLRREGYFDADTIGEAWRWHLSGDRNAEYPLWTVLMFQAWLEATQGSPVHGSAAQGPAMQAARC